MKLPPERFKSLIRDSVLVSLDLVILNEKEEVLVGRRRNPPARGWWFVPGGRICKGEAPGEALRRISREETGVELCARDAALRGIYHHRYPENCFEMPDIGPTEYLVIACQFRLRSETPIQLSGQHEDMKFVSICDVPTHREIHEYTRNYFRERPENLFLRGECDE